MTTISDGSGQVNLRGSAFFYFTDDDFTDDEQERSDGSQNPAPAQQALAIAAIQSGKPESKIQFSGSVKEG